MSVTPGADLNLRTRSYISVVAGEGRWMQLGLVGRGIQSGHKLSGFVTYHPIIGKWGLEQNEEKAHLQMSFKNLS